MASYVFIPVIVISNLIIAISCQSGYDTLDPWGDLSKPLYKSDSTNELYETDVSSLKANVPKESFSYDEVLAYYKRLINIVFKRSAFKIDGEDNDILVRNIYLRVSHDQFTRLSNPLQTSEDFRKVDGVISDIFSNCDGGFYDKAYEIFESWYHMFSVYSQQPFAKIILLVSVFLILLIYMRYVSQLSTTKICMMLLIIAAYCWTYYDMYMEAEVNRIVELKQYTNPPKECSIDSMSFYDKMMYKMTRAISSDVCKDYYMLTRTTTFETVNPAIVAVEMITRLVTQPLATASEKLGQGLSNLFYSIPMPLSIILFPIALVFFLIILIFFACYALGIHVNFNIFHLISFSIGSNTNSEPPSSIKYDDISIMATALRDAQMNKVTGSDLNRLEQRLLDQCEQILKHKNSNSKQKMIENTNVDETIPIASTSECKPLQNSRVTSNSNSKEILEDNDENIDSSNDLNLQMKRNSSTSPSGKSKNNNIRVKKVVNSLMKNINDLENRLEQANKSIDEKMAVLKNAARDDSST